MIHHLAFRTTDVERLERFYCGVLGLDVRKKDDRSTWLRLGDSAILMIEPAAENEPEIVAGSMELTCFAIAAADADAVRARLAESGVLIEGSTTYSIYFRDPDGRRIGVSSYPAPLC